MDRFLNFSQGGDGGAGVVAGDTQLTSSGDERLISAFFTDSMRDQCRFDRPLDETPAPSLAGKLACRRAVFFICSSQTIVTEGA